MEPRAIEVTGLSKTYGAVTAVEDLSFTAQPGRITGFLGPNGAGKSTTLRILVGLVAATAGSARIGGQDYRGIDRPATVVGAQFEGAFHPGRTGREHLRAFAPLAGVDDARCDEVLEMVGISDASRRRVSGYSLGMRQRLGLATALLGDPSVLVLDESANGLDPAGIRWLREFLRDFAQRGGTVLLSSHLLSEVEQTVDDVVVIAGGTLRHQSTLAELRGLAQSTVDLHSPDAEGLKRLIDSHFADGGTVSPDDPTRARISGARAAQVGAAAFAAGLEVHTLAEAGENLEQVFLQLTQPATEAEVAA